MKPIPPILAILIFTRLVSQAADPAPGSRTSDNRDAGDAAKVPGKEDYIIREWKVPHDFFLQPPAPPKREDGAKDSPIKGAAARNQITEFLARNGVTFSAEAIALYRPASETLLMKNTQAEIDKIDALIDAYFDKALKRIPPR